MKLKDCSDKNPVKNEPLRVVNNSIRLYVYALLLTIYSYFNNSSLIFTLTQATHMSIFAFNSLLFAEDADIRFSSLQFEKPVKNKIRLYVGAVFLMTSFFIASVVLDNKAVVKIGYIIIYTASIIVLVIVKRIKN